MKKTIYDLKLSANSILSASDLAGLKGGCSLGTCIFGKISPFQSY
jgi:hypothetical protein